MHPILFEVPGLGIPIRAFGVMVAAGFLLGAHLWARLSARYGDDPARDPERTSQVALWILVGVLVGARLLYVTVEIARWLQAGRPENMAGAAYVSDPLQILFIWEGGLVMYGALFGGILLGTWAARRAGMRPIRALDVALVGAFVGLAVGRIGCLLVGDDYGSVVPPGMETLPPPIAITVPSAEWLEAHPESLFDRELAGKTIWATQLWMSANALVLAGVGYWLLRRRRYGGQVTWWLILLYALTRFTIECFRGDTVRGKWFGDAISTSQLISIAAGLFAAWRLVANRGRVDTPPVPEQTGGAP